ncbi:uracil-DNA glycosylase [Bdellovibrio svalbardensis]|uniref:Uracil-DNA glycosylase n=1 Tax=Bdellovibrio svalbardensis TaxID=2972972 RepID=A0ABT6DJK3_9BACT|nr:uracil-DNA glycosylase [Bdellovibrio svalbardensis]MDG0815268.1 uracil-DNA glycosylase [Bdellovibrio svalbardensis]
MCQGETKLESELKLHSSWKSKLQSEFEKSSMKKLTTFLADEYKKGKVIYPQEDDLFAALNLTPLDKVKVVIVGQDPYHGPGQAHGLCFSVQDGVRFPPSLRNIFKELQEDVGVAIPKSGSLKKWAEHGVLLLNAVLTVEDGKANAHQGKGWEEFTDKVIHLVNEERENVVFILWGSYAQKKAAFVDRKKHFVIESVHPSPLSAHRGFFGTKPFSRANAYLKSKGLPEVDWSL